MGSASCRPEKNRRILMLGLDKSGKTTILYQCRIGQVVTTITTIGFNLEMLKVKDMTFDVWDIGGQDRLRALWHHYYAGTEGLFYVVDSSDEERLKEARDELHKTLASEEMKGVPLVVLANKQDLQQAAEEYKVEEILELSRINDRKWCIESTSAVTGKKGLTKMAQFLNKK